MSYIIIIFNIRIDTGTIKLSNNLKITMNSIRIKKKVIIQS